MYEDHIESSRCTIKSHFIYTFQAPKIIKLAKCVSYNCKKRTFFRSRMLISMTIRSEVCKNNRFKRQLNSQMLFLIIFITCIYIIDMFYLL